MDSEALIEKLNVISQECRKAIGNMRTTEDMEKMQKQYFGRKGKITDIARKLGQLQPKDRKRVGEMINFTRDVLLMSAHERVLIDEKMYPEEND